MSELVTSVPEVLHGEGLVPLPVLPPLPLRVRLRGQVAAVEDQDGLDAVQGCHQSGQGDCDLIDLNLLGS